MPYRLGMDIITVALAFWPLWVALAVTWVVSRIERGKSMGTALIFLCIAVMIVGPALYMAGKLGASALVAWIAVSFIVLGLVAL